MDYLIKDFTNHETTGKVETRIVSDQPNDKSGLWHELEQAKAGKSKISVYVISECVIDWS